MDNITLLVSGERSFHLINQEGFFMPRLNRVRGKRLLMIKDLVRLYPAFSESQVRAWLRVRHENGLSVCVVQPNQRRLYFDVDEFERWLHRRTAEMQEVEG